MKTVFIIYFSAISLVAVIITVFDKRRAVRHGWRVSEATLLAVAALGGSAAMLLTMMAVRHKTRKLKFMLGIPLIIACQLALLFFVGRGIFG